MKWLRPFKSRVESPGPFRPVVQIRDIIGERGGELWELTLGCGHTVARRKPRVQVDRPSSVLRPRFAPRTVRCISCPPVPAPRPRKST